MPEFQNPVDIGNRAAQHCGAKMMDQSLGYGEISKTARQIGFIYGKKRQSELRQNVWTFATRRTALRAIDTGTMSLAPSLWVGSVSYFAGSVVDDGSGTLWVSKIQNNLNIQPPSLTLTAGHAAWEPYFGPMTASLWASGTSYFSGEIVYTAPGDGTYRVYMNLLDGNQDNPATATAWSATATYNTSQVVTYLSVAYKSLIDLNINQIPSSAPAAWSAATTYATGNSVYSTTTGLIYTSVGNGNIGHDPSSDSGTNWTNTNVLCPWTTVIAGGTGSLNWLEIGGAEFASGVGLTKLNIFWPVGTGPLSQGFTRNAFRLPAGFLRIAPQNPGSGVMSWGGGPSGLTYRDWAFTGKYLLTAETGPILFRFVADFQDVTAMDPLFCEGLAISIAEEAVEPLTQSTAKLATIKQSRKDTMYTAKLENAIEQGIDEPPDDDFLTVRA